MVFVVISTEADRRSGEILHQKKLITIEDFSTTLEMTFFIVPVSNLRL